MQSENNKGQNNHKNGKEFPLRQDSVAPFTSHSAKTFDVPYGEKYHNYGNKMHNLLIAIYMVTDLVEREHAVKDALRMTATQALSSIHELYHQAIQGHPEILKDTHGLLNECSRYFDVLFRTGYISPMNYRVILAEIRKLQDALLEHAIVLAETVPLAYMNNDEFVIPPSFFESASLSESQERDASETIDPVESSRNYSSPLKDAQAEPIFVKKPELNKKTLMTKVIDRYKDKKTSQTSKKREPQANVVKEARKENILKILKQKKDATINDISLLFKDCSTKTIQRDLNELIDEKKVIKKGSRRWSTYHLV